MPQRSRHLVPTALTYLCHQSPRDLLRDWLKAAPRLGSPAALYVNGCRPYAHAAPDVYSQEYRRRLLVVSLVARALDPGCQYRFVVILEGPENTGKTKLVRALATPEWYRGLSQGLDGKEAHMRVKRAWVAELAESSPVSPRRKRRA